MSDQTAQGPAGPEHLLELNFVPSWAREPAGRNPYERFDGPAGPGPRGRDARAPDRRPGPRGDRRGPAAQGRARGERGARGFGGRDRADRRPSAEGRGPRRGGREAVHERPLPEHLPVDFSFVPERQMLATVARDLRASKRAYPLAYLAARFLASPALYLVKIESRARQPGQPPAPLYQCRECRAVFTEAEGLADHVVAAHLEKYFVREDVQRDPPTGNFTCVARCRLTGEILGPPNYHGYNERVQELRNLRFPHLSLDEYRKSIETVHDADLVERWKQEQTRRTVYRLKGEENAAALKLQQAKTIMEERFLPGLVAKGARFVIPAEAATHTQDRRLLAALRAAWTSESRRPFTLMLALRPAFHHMRLHLFRANPGTAFVTAVEPHPIRPEQAVASIAEALNYLRSHPGCTRQQLVAELRPGVAADSAEVASVISSLTWLIEKGHVIEFFDGTLAVPGPRGARKEPASTPASA